MRRCDAWRLASTRGPFGRRGTTRAAHWYRRLCELWPDSTTPRIFLGSALARQGRLEEAAAEYEQATRLEPHPDEAWLNLALVRRAQGRNAEALDHARDALRLDPGYEHAQQVIADVEEALRLHSADS